MMESGRMKLTLLGTGHAMVTECYNTCFVIEEDGKHFLVDGGGGNGILHQLKAAGLDWRDLRDIFVTHKHLDHLMGIVWMIRSICQSMRHQTYQGEARIYAHEELITLMRDMAQKLLSEVEASFLDDRLHLIEVHDGESKSIIGHEVTFFDIRSTKAKQFGFCMELNDHGKLVCCGDEPLKEWNRNYAKGSRWLLHEAFCLHSEADLFEPYEKHHSTVKDACELAEEMGVENLILYHTEDKNLKERKERYAKEGQRYFHGNLLIPDDLESIIII